MADAQYECLVQAKNRYGWSEASRIHRFYTHFRRGKSTYEWSTFMIREASCKVMMWFDYAVTL